MSKKLGFFSTYGDGLGLVPVFQEKYDVTVHIKDPFFRGMYDGFVPKDNDIRHLAQQLTKSDIAYFDCAGLGSVGDSLRAKGVAVYGGQIIADKLEEDRMFGLKMMQMCGIKVPYTVKFSTRQEGISFIKKNPHQFVYKPYGGGKASAMTFVSHDSTEMLSFMSTLKKDEEYILQIFVEGMEYSTEMFFSKGNAVEPSFHTIEDKKAYSGEVGPATGCMSTVQIADKDLSGKAVKNGLGKMFEWLKKVQYTGNLDLNSIIDKQGNLWGIEFTGRDGWSSTYARNEMLDEKVTMLYDYIARGEAKKVELLADVFGLAIRVAIPPYPLESNEANSKWFNPIARLSADKKIVVKPHKDITYHFLDVRSGKDALLTNGATGIIVEVCTKDKDIVKGKERLVAAIDDITLDDKWYRSDAFDRAVEQLPLIEKAGYYGPRNL